MAVIFAKVYNDAFFSDEPSKLEAHTDLTK